MIGYLLLGITFLFYVGLISINISEPKMAGEAGMGYGLSLFALGAGFAICSLFLTISIANKGGFHWVSNQGSYRTLLAGFGWLFLVATTFACAVFKWEWHEGEFPQYLRWLAVANGQLWIPLLMFIPYFLLLNSDVKSSLSPDVIKLPLMICFCISAVCSAGLLYGWMRTSAKNQAAQIEKIQTEENRIHDEHLTFIASQKPTDPILYLLVYSGRFHDLDVKEAALKKIKGHPDWEAELIRLLDNEHYFPEVYTFIDGNKVDHPDLFLDPLNRSILRMADKIEKEIKTTYNLQGWSFESYNIERMLRAVDEQFIHIGMDFRPAIVRLSEALKTKPSEGLKKNIQFEITPVVDLWLKNHKMSTT